MTSLATRRNFLPETVETLKKILTGSESTGLVFGVENHGRTSNDPEFLDALFAGQSNADGRASTWRKDP